jgi:hypothetical protein
LAHGGLRLFLVTHSPSFSLSQTDKQSFDAFARLHELLGDHSAVAMVRAIAFVAHVWDDLIDGDQPVTAGQINDAFHACTVGLLSNPFVQRHAAAIWPVLETSILNWHGANQLEQIGTDHALQVAHVTRCAVGDVAVLAASLIHGHAQAAELAAEIRMLVQQDSLEDYIADFRQRS